MREASLGVLTGVPTTERMLRRVVQILRALPLFFLILFGLHLLKSKMKASCFTLTLLGVFARFNSAG